MLSPCLFKTFNSICSSDFSIGPSRVEEPPKAVGQIQSAGWVSFPLPVTAHVTNTHSWMTEWGVQLYLGARVGYLALYAAGVFLLRSLDETPLGGPSGMLVQDQPRC